MSELCSSGSAGSVHNGDDSAADDAHARMTLPQTTTSSDGVPVTRRHEPRLLSLPQAGDQLTPSGRSGAHCSNKGDNDNIHAPVVSTACDAAPERLGAAGHADGPHFMGSDRSIWKQLMREKKRDKAEFSRILRGELDLTRSGHSMTEPKTLSSNDLCAKQDDATVVSGSRTANAPLTHAEGDTAIKAEQMISLEDFGAPDAYREAHRDPWLRGLDDARVAAADFGGETVSVEEQNALGDECGGVDGDEELNGPPKIPLNLTLPMHPLRVVVFFYFILFLLLGIPFVLLILSFFANASSAELTLVRTQYVAAPLPLDLTHTSSLSDVLQTVQPPDVNAAATVCEAYLASFCDRFQNGEETGTDLFWSWALRTVDGINPFMIATLVGWTAAPYQMSNCTVSSRNGSDTVGHTEVLVDTMSFVPADAVLSFAVSCPSSFSTEPAEGTVLLQVRSSLFLHYHSQPTKVYLPHGLDALLKSGKAHNSLSGLDVPMFGRYAHLLCVSVSVTLVPLLVLFMLSFLIPSYRYTLTQLRVALTVDASRVAEALLQYRLCTRAHAAARRAAHPYGTGDYYTNPSDGGDGDERSGAAPHSAAARATDTDGVGQNEVGRNRGDLFSCFVPWWLQELRRKIKGSKTQRKDKERKEEGTHSDGDAEGDERPPFHVPTPQEVADEARRIIVNRRLHQLHVIEWTHVALGGANLVAFIMTTINLAFVAQRLADRINVRLDDLPEVHKRRYSWQNMLPADVIDLLDCPACTLDVIERLHVRSVVKAPVVGLMGTSLIFLAAAFLLRIYISWAGIR